MKKKIFQNAISIIVSVVLLYIVVKNLNFNRLMHYVSTGNYFLFMSSVLVFILAYGFKAHRWFLLIRPADKLTKIKQVYPPFFLGFAANNFLPFRIGEFIRAGVLSKNTGFKISYSLSSVFIDRIFDGLVLLLLLTASIYFLPLPQWTINIGLIAGTIFIGSLIFLLVLRKYNEVSINILGGRFSVIIEKINEIITQVIESIKIFDNIRELLYVFGFSIIVWLFESLMYFIVAAAFDMEVSLLESILIMTILNFGILLPSSPAYIGTFEFFCIKSLQIFGYEAEKAAAFAFTLHGLQFVSLSLLGIIFLNVQGISVKQAKSIGEETKESQ